VSIVLDAGAFLAVERGDRDMVALIKRERREGRAPLSHSGIVGQVWRGGSGRQGTLSRALPGVDVHPLDEDLGRRAGLLLGVAEQADVIDAALVLLAHDGDEIYTSDTGDLRDLAVAAGLHVELIPV
jgi:hypothetical protein